MRNAADRQPELAEPARRDHGLPRELHVTDTEADEMEYLRGLGYLG